MELFLESKDSSIQKMVDKKTQIKSTRGDWKYAWGEDCFNLNASSLFTDLSYEQKEKVLVEASEIRLQSALLIEELGLAYCAQMNALSTTREERLAFSLMGADEARHFESIKVLSNPKKKRSLGMSELVKDIVDLNDRKTGLFLLQVMLEGYGLKYYHLLGETSQVDIVKNTFREIAFDEAFHHGLGTELFKETGCKERDEYDIVSVGFCERFVRSFVGDEWLIRSLEHGLGEGISTNDKSQFLEETKWHDKLRARLQIVKKLVEQNAPKSWLSELEKRKTFEV